MDTDSGITRRLPPPIENEMDIKVKERNILNVMINKYDKLMVNNKPGDLATLKDETKRFITPNPNDEKAPEIEMKEIELLGTIMTNKGVVSLKTTAELLIRCISASKMNSLVLSMSLETKCL